MNFKCSGAITRLTFLGWLSESSEDLNVTGRLTSWPYFSLWHQDRQYTGGSAFEKMNQLHYDQLSISINRSILNNQLVEVTLMTNVTFNQGDILGIRRQQRYPIENDINMAVLKQSGVYGRTQICDAGNHEFGWCTEPAIEIQEKVYISIAIETGEM
jgi:hypothetical protein